MEGMLELTEYDSVSWPAISLMPVKSTCGVRSLGSSLCP